MVPRSAPLRNRNPLRPLFLMVIFGGTMFFVFQEKSPLAWWAEQSWSAKEGAKEGANGSAGKGAITDAVFSASPASPGASSDLGAGSATKRPAAQGPAPEVAPSRATLEPSWRQDLRWQEAVRLAALAESDWKKAVAEQEKEGGLILAAFQKEAAKRIEEAMALLDALAFDFSDSPAAQAAITKKRRSVERKLRHLRH